MLSFNNQRKKLFEVNLIFMSGFLCCYSLCKYTYFERNDNRGNYGCETWNVTSCLKTDSSLKTLEIHFEPFPPYKKCFWYYKVHLFRLRFDHGNVCDYRRGWLINSSTVTENKHSKRVIFTNLRNGSYCFVIEPCSSKCFSGWSLHFNVLNLQNESEKKPVEYKKTAASISEILAIGILILAFLSGVLMCWHYKTRKRIKKTSQLEDVCKDEESLPLLEPKDINVYILHPFDESTTRKVARLKDFLVKCAEFKVFTMEDQLHVIYASPRIWLKSILDYKCSKKVNGCGSDKKIIIVQTEKVTKLMKYDISNFKKESFESLSPSEEEENDEWYEYAFNCISIDWSRCFHDYCHLFVVCFDDVLCYDEHPGSITRRVRYSKPSDLINLCSDLCCKFKDKAVKEQLLHSLENHPIKDVFL